MNRAKNLPMGTRRGALLAMALILLPALGLTAEQLYSPEWGYALDLPEGYLLTDRDGSKRYNFTHQLFPAQLQMALYGRSEFPSSELALEHVTKQLGSTGPNVTFTWRSKEASIARVESKPRAGWALAVELDGDKGWLVMACTTAPEKATALEPLIISTLDGVYTDEGSWFEPGPMTAFAWAPDGALTREVTFGNRTERVPFQKIDAEASQALIDREFGLLTGYLKSDHMYPAWKRYYRMIYRDSWSRLEKASFFLASSLPTAPEEAAAKLLAWTQSFTYERNREGADFLNLPDTLVTSRGDCDSRALLMVLILNQMGIDAILLISPEHSHALAAVDCPGQGARFAHGGKKYLIADTTAKVGMGNIAADMADPAAWFAVSFPAFP